MTVLKPSAEIPTLFITCPFDGDVASTKGSDASPYLTAGGTAYASSLDGRIGSHVHRTGSTEPT
ncbi:MAG: hypothetical protein OJF47_004172 [Nitrospira sp.]|nr:MAG: hypothetical protein OJF47_004172 [Nitrospira sp.]